MGCDLVDASVDYIWLTAELGAISIELLNAGYKASEHERFLGMGEGKAHALQGYRGELVGRVFYGSREDGSTVRASGSAAQTVLEFLGDRWDRLGCPRIDIQVTGRFPYDYESYGRETAEAYDKARAGASAGRPASVHLVRGFGGGDTCSIGARSSQRYLRCYDKTREQAGLVDDNLWRWEVEYKPPLSRVVLDRVMSSGLSRCYIIGQVYQEWESKGVPPPWESTDIVPGVRVEITKSTLETTLHWLRTQVAPTLRRLDRGGYTGAYMSALGLDCQISDDSLE